MRTTVWQWKLQRGSGIGCFLLGRDDRDHVKAVEWLEKAAEQGVVDAIYLLAKRFQFGLGVPKDDARAFPLFLRAAELGNMLACRIVSESLETGTPFLRKDLVESAKWVARTEFTRSDQGVKRDLIYLLELHRRKIKVDNCGASVAVIYAVGNELVNRRAVCQRWNDTRGDDPPFMFAMRLYYTVRLAAVRAALCTMWAFRRKLSKDVAKIIAGIVFASRESHASLWYVDYVSDFDSSARSCSTFSELESMLPYYGTRGRKASHVGVKKRR